MWRGQTVRTFGMTGLIAQGLFLGYLTPCARCDAFIMLGTDVPYRSFIQDRGRVRIAQLDIRPQKTFRAPGRRFELGRWSGGMWGRHDRKRSFASRGEDPTRAPSTIRARAELPRGAQGADDLFAQGRPGGGACIPPAGQGGLAWVRRSWRAGRWPIFTCGCGGWGRPYGAARYLAIETEKRPASLARSWALDRWPMPCRKASGRRRVSGA